MTAVVLIPLRYEEKIRPTEASSAGHSPQPTTDKTQVTNTNIERKRLGLSERKQHLFYMDKIIFCKNVNIINKPVEMID